MEIFLPWLWVQFTFLQAWIYGHLVLYGTAHFTDDLSLKVAYYSFIKKSIFEFFTNYEKTALQIFFLLCKDVLWYLTVKQTKF